MISSLVKILAAAVARCGSVASADEAWTPADGDSLTFEVLRNGKPFGDHTVTFDHDGDKLTVKTDISLKVKVGPFTPFQYAHGSTETWRDGQLMTLSGRTRKDGDDLMVEAEIVGDALQIDGSAFDGAAPLDLIPSSHWNKRQLNGEEILSTETGELLPVEVEYLGLETIEAANETIEAGKYLLKSDLDVLLWYDADGRWVKCAFEARGQKVEYVLKAADASSEA
ncbi:MAG: DUF6134 family protein [Pseudomonadota bacterium]